MISIRATLGQAIALASVALLLAGCATSSSTVVAAPTGGSSTAPVIAPSSPGTLRGHTQAGPGQISNAHIYLLAAATSAYGAPSLSLLDPTAPGVLSDAHGAYVITDASGNFSLTGAYHCTPGQLVYILSQGGSPGGESDNPYLALLSTFGVCPAAGNFAGEISFININQVSTVVTVYALAGFMTDTWHVSSGPSANAVAGLAHSFLAVPNLIDSGAGVVLPATPGGNGVPPVTTIDTLANILVPCSVASSACASLFTLAPDSAGKSPADTVQALLNIARQPAANVPALFTLAGSQPFRPALAAAPNDWTVGVTYYSQTMAGPYFPAVDGAGNLWVPGYANNTLTEFDPLGNLLSGANGFQGGGLAQPAAVAIDAGNNAWVTSYGAAQSTTPLLSEFAPNGSPASAGSPCGQSCSFVAIDASQNLWVSSAPQVSVLRPNGATLTAFNANTFTSGVAVDSQGHGWAIGSGRNLSRLTIPATITQFPETVSFAGGNELNALAIDAGDNIWFTSPKNNTVGKFSNAGAALSPASGFTGGGLNGPVGLAVDGSGRVWVANRDGNSISAFDATGKPLTPAAGYVAAGVSNPRGIAIDPSGNVWITSFTGNAVTEFLGAATPTASPMTSTNHGQLP